MKRLILTLIMLIHFVSYGQNGGRYVRERVDKNGDVTYIANIPTVFIFAKDRRGKALQKKYARLINAVKVSYPISIDARNKLNEMNRVLPTLNSKAEQRRYTKSVEDELKEKYTPILKKMSMYQGIVLLKLIDRETGSSSYSLVKELRGGLSAFFWQGVAKMFGANLKQEYDQEGDDRIIEELIELYEKGLL